MKKLFKHFIFPTLFSLLNFSCQRELNFEKSQFSIGSLKGGITGDCLPKNVGGTFLAEKDLTDTNYIDVEVNVTGTGTYLIRTDTVNGYSFKGTGIFSSTGSNIVRLAGTGKPLVDGSDDFTVMYDTSDCYIRVIVMPPGGINAAAVFIVEGTPGTCIPARVTGNYIKNHSLTSADSVSIGLMVTSPGSYTISTNTVNGYSFSGSGLVTTAGLQTISLTAIGTPVNSGINVFTVTAGTSICTFPVVVTSAIAITNNDYFPLTKNSYWIYDNLLIPGDSIKRLVGDTVRTNNILYSIIEEPYMFGMTRQSFFRKAGNDYFEYGSVDKLTTSFSYQPQVNGEIPFLKENIITGDSWKSIEFTGTFSGGQQIFLQYNFYCMDGNAALTLNGNTFINVYKIRMLPQVRSQFGPLNSTGELVDIYYAKGVGIIYIKATRDGFNKIELRIRRWMVF